MRAGVFISYAHADTSLVKPLYTALVDAGQDVWRDTEDLPPGVDWRDGVMQAIEGSAVVVFVLTPESARSEWCSRELKHARAHDKPLIPFCLPPGSPRTRNR
jgi:hypothetical protein